MAFAVGDVVIVQKLGGLSGLKPVSPIFNGVIEEVLDNGQYRVRHVQKGPSVGHFPVFFKDGIVDELEITSLQ